MKYADMHCDTATEIYTQKQSLYDNTLHISLRNAQKYSPYCQVFAIWTPKEKRGAERFNNFKNVYDNFIKELNKNKKAIALCKNYSDIEKTASSGKIAALLAIEGGGALNGDLTNIMLFKELGVRFLTLTWNGSNELGDGAISKNKQGLTDFGKNALKELEKNGIIADVSHLSQRGFWDVCELSQKPFVATHSNSKTVCKHMRSLTDEQFKAIKEKGGLVGINICSAFLKKNEQDAQISDIISHIEHFLSLDGENTIAFGADFDGISTTPKGIKNIADIEKIANEMLKQKFSQKQVDKIFFDNFMSFCKQNLL